jgi:DNA-binding helix-hairpin-helix protein with protein kinase domain
MDKAKLHKDELDGPSAEEHAKLLEEEACGLTRCSRHPMHVYHEKGEECPACQASREWLEHLKNPRSRQQRNSSA